jgi:hypothetical protein
MRGATYRLLPGTGRGTSVAGGGGPLQGGAGLWAPSVSPAGCHLPGSGEELK